MRPRLLLTLLLILLVPLAWPAGAAERVALVIGNAAYRNAPPLKNTLNDARDMADTLRGLGFELAGGKPLENTDRTTMAVAINRFLAGVQNRAGIALIYYSGHGMRNAAGATYLLPTDAQIAQEPDIAAVGVGLSGVLDQLDNRPKGAVSLVIVDACRNNPFGVGGKGERRGLGELTPPRGTLLLYAASPGQEADDNQRGNNGLFTAHLLTQLKTPGLDVEDAFDAVSLAVEDASRGRQIPWSGGNLRGKVYLAGAPGAAGEDAPPPLATSAPTVATTTPNQTWTEPKTGMEFVWVPGGSFQMGCGGAWAGECEDDEKPARQVALKGYWMAKTEVTQAQWQKVMGSNPSSFKGCTDCPVESVSWNDAQAFIAKLDPGGQQGLRLPTEAEWEYACRSGGKEDLYCGGSDLDRLGWYGYEKSGKKTHPVGGKTANGLGLYDMSGNVWEWTCSAYEEQYAGAERECSNKNDLSPRRVLRGGSWFFDADSARATFRGRRGTGVSFKGRGHGGAGPFGGGTGDRGGSVGLRLARTPHP